MIKLDNDPKYSIGDTVILEYVFDPSGLGSMKKLDEPITVEVIKVSTTSTGYGYQLKSHQDISLGGIIYWEEDISHKALSKTEEEENMWRTWGDH